MRIPVARAATTSTTELSHFVALGIVDRLAGHNGSTTRGSPRSAQRIAAGQVAEIGDSVRLDLEALLSLRPDLVLASSIGNAELDVSTCSSGPGFPTRVDAAWTEATPLGRAEWLKFTAAFFNREAEANRIFDGIAARYEELAALARTVEDGRRSWSARRSRAPGTSRAAPPIRRDSSPTPEAPTSGPTIRPPGRSRSTSSASMRAD